MPWICLRNFKKVTSDPDRYGSALPEIEKQIGNIQSEFSQFVTLILQVTLLKRLKS